MKKVIYDFGSYDGNDIPYYLLKADRVIAVEANPMLADKIVEQFKENIDNGSLVVVNKAIAPNDHEIKKFYIHKEWLTNSTLVPPPAHQLIDYIEIDVEAVDPIDLIRQYGDPYYVKLDIEGLDHEILKHMFCHDIKPPFISAESHHISTFCEMVSAGYHLFKLVDGPSVSTVYKNAVIFDINSNPVEYDFHFHTSGPFGDDIKGDWASPDDFFKVLSVVGLGWKDIHAMKQS